MIGLSLLRPTHGAVVGQQAVPRVLPPLRRRGEQLWPPRSASSPGLNIFPDTAILVGASGGDLRHPRGVCDAISAPAGHAADPADPDVDADHGAGIPRHCGAVGHRGLRQRRGRGGRTSAGHCWASCWRRSRACLSFADRVSPAAVRHPGESGPLRAETQAGAGVRRRGRPHPCEGAGPGVAEFDPGGEEDAQPGDGE